MGTQSSQKRADGLESDGEWTVQLEAEGTDREALASLLLYCRQEAERQGLQFSAYLIGMSVESLGNADQRAKSRPPAQKLG